MTSYCLMIDDRFESGSVLYASYEDMYNDIKTMLDESLSENEMEEELDTIEYIDIEENRLGSIKYDYDLRDYFVN